MDYKKLAERLKCPQIRECPINGKQPSCKKCQHKISKDAATAITDLLARAEAAEARAEKAERERDAAVADLRLVSDCRTCGNVSPWCIDNPDRCKGWEWRGRKEE